MPPRTRSRTTHSRPASPKSARAHNAAMDDTFRKSRHSAKPGPARGSLAHDPWAITVPTDARAFERNGWKDTDEAHFAIQNKYVFSFLNPGSDY